MIAKLHYNQFIECMDECDLALMRIKASNEFEGAKLANCKMHLDTVRDTVESLYLIGRSEEDE